jgi:uncharacterized protein YndB with AHSA1/START domain
MAMTGVYKEVVAPERVTRTETFEMGCGPQSGEQVATMAFTERGGKTTVTITVTFPSKEARDAMIASGMEKGVEAGYERLDELLKTMAR